MNQDKTTELVSSNNSTTAIPSDLKENNDATKETTRGNSSVSMATIQIINTVIGAGILSLPVVIRYLGIVFGTIFFIAMWAATIYSVVLLLKAQEITEKRTYALIAKSTLGDIGYIAVILMIMINNFGICCAYFRIFGENMQNIFQAFVSPNSYWVTNWHNYIYVLFIFIIMGLLLFFESLESLAQVSSLGVVGIFVFMIGLFTIYFYKLDQGLLNVFQSKQFLPSGPFLELMTSLPTVFLAFSFQFNVFPIYYTLRERKRLPMTKATVIGISMCLFFYLCTGILGFLLYQYQLKYTILQSMLVDMQIYKDTDSFLKFLLIIANIGFLCCCTTGIPVLFFSLKENLFSLIVFCQKKWEQYSLKPKDKPQISKSGIPPMNENNNNVNQNPSQNEAIKEENKYPQPEELHNKTNEDLIDSNSGGSLNTSKIVGDNKSTNSSNKKKPIIEFQTQVYSVDQPKEKEMIEFDKEKVNSIKVTSTTQPIANTDLNNNIKRVNSLEYELPKKTKVIIIFVMYGLIGIVTLIIPQVKTIFNLVGSTAANATSFIIPSLMIIKLASKRQIEINLVLPFILLAIGIIVLIGCLTSEIINANR